MAKQFTLGKHERLKSRKSIELLFKEGKKFVAHPYLVYYGLAQFPKTTGKSFTLQFGVGAGTKNFKKAVDRNRIKRLTREAFRLQKTALKENLKSKDILLNLFLIYTAKEIPGYNEVCKKLGAILKKLETMIEEIK